MFFHLALLLLATREVIGGAIQPDKHIVGGVDVPEGGRPFQVSLDVESPSEFYRSPFFHFCGGSILNKEWVLTAAHCMIYPVKNVSVLTGTNRLSEGGKRYQVVKSIIHEKFDKNYIFDYDIALLKINDTFTFDNKTAPISLPKENTGGGVSCITSGWGYTDNYRSTTDDLKMLTVNSLSNKDCRENGLKLYQKKYPLTDNQICTFKERGKGICQGDSGGPLTCEGELVGLMSYNIPCARGFPDVYTRVYEFKDWIAKNMK